MNLGKIPYDVTGIVDLKSNISKSREYFSAKFGRYLFLHFLNRMTSLLCQFINFFKGGRVPLMQVGSVQGDFIRKWLVVNEWEDKNRLDLTLYRSNCSSLYMIYILKRCATSRDQLVKTYTTYICPLLEYCAPLFHAVLTAKQASQLEKLKSCKNEHLNWSADSTYHINNFSRHWSWSHWQTEGRSYA